MLIIQLNGLNSAPGTHMMEKKKPSTWKLFFEHTHNLEKNKRPNRLISKFFASHLFHAKGGVNDDLNIKKYSRIILFRCKPN